MPIIVTCALFMENLDATIITTLIPTIAKDFGAPPLHLKLALTSYLLSLALFIPASGWLADALGFRRVFCAAIVLFTLGSVACGVSTSVVQLVIARILQGTGGALMVPVARLVLMRIFKKEELVHIINLVTIPALIGPAVGPLIGGFMATYAHWRAVFFINIPFCLIALWLTTRHLREYISPKARPLDGTGFFMFGLALASLSLCLEALGENILPTVLLIAVAWISFVFFALYARHAKRHPAPFLNLKLFTLRTFRLGALGSFASRISIGALPFLLPLYYQTVLGHSPLVSGTMLFPASVGMVSMRLWVKPLLARYGFKSLLALNSRILGLAIAMMACIHVGTPVWQVMAQAFVYGCLASVHFACVNVLVYVDVGPEQMGDASGIYSTIQQFSMSCGVALGALFLRVTAAFLDHTPPALFGAAEPSATAFRSTFLVLGLATFLTTAIFGRLGPIDGAVAAGHQAAD